MNEINILESNKMIADFIGLRSINKCIRDVNGRYYDYYANSKLRCIKEQEIQIESENGYGLVEQDFLFIEDLKFHIDWNWLMEVIEKIECMGYCVDIIQYHSKDKQFCGIGKYDKIGTKSIEKTKIEAVYNACEKFIKWYNQK